VGTIGYILAAVAGALVSGFLLERFKRTDDRRGIASAIAGEISGILNNALVRKLPEYFEDLIPKLKSPTPPPPPWIYFDPSYNATPVFDSHVGRIGFLGRRLPERVAQFYALYGSVRTEAKTMAGGFYDKNPAGAGAVVERTLVVWRQVETLGEALIDDLLAISGEQPR
jgi:hypothetical protein